MDWLWNLEEFQCLIPLCWTYILLQEGGELTACWYDRFSPKELPSRTWKNLCCLVYGTVPQPSSVVVKCPTINIAFLTGPGLSFESVRLQQRPGLQTDRACLGTKGKFHLLFIIILIHINNPVTEWQQYVLLCLYDGSKIFISMFSLTCVAIAAPPALEMSLPAANQRHRSVFFFKKSTLSSTTRLHLPPLCFTLTSAR